MHVVAIDVGERKIGLAVGDATTRMGFARPALLVDSWAEVWQPLLKFISDEQATHIVVGLPLNTDGTLGAQARRVKEFIQHLSEQTTLPIVEFDERQTSIAVQREQQEIGRQLKRGEEDSLAAQLIAESFLVTA